MAEREKPLTQRALAALFDVDARTIRNWTEAGCPTRRLSGRPMYLLSEVIPWRREKDREEARGGESLDEARERARKLKEDADRLALANAQRRRELVPAHQVAAQWERTLGVCRSRILAARGKWAPRVLGLGTMAEATAVLDQLADDLLATLRDGADEVEAADDESAEDAA